MLYVIYAVVGHCFRDLSKSHSATTDWKSRSTKVGMQMYGWVIIKVAESQPRL